MLELDIIKNELFNSVNHQFELIQERPRINTKYGFAIDGRRTDKDNFKELYDYLNKYGYTSTTIRDADNNNQTVETFVVKELYELIVAFSFDLYQRKWDLLKAINDADTIEDIHQLNITLIDEY